jgi:phage shock protein A
MKSSSNCCRRCVGAWPTSRPAASGSSCSCKASQQKEGTLEEQARAALAQGREDLAREALTRRSGLHQQIVDLQSTSWSQLQEQEDKLTAAAQQLQTKVESFRTRKETIKASYSAAEATTKINEAFAGISQMSSAT